MERVLLSRQPIYGANTALAGYELLFRDSDSDKARIRDEDEATAQVVMNTFMEIGLNKAVGPHLAFINVSKNFLLSDFCEALPAKRIVLELLDPVEVDSKLINRVDELVSKGYKIAVGEFVFGEKYRPLLSRVSIIKFDLLQEDWRAIQSNLSSIGSSRIKCAAERIETSNQFNICREVGFDYYQGYYFSRPEFVRASRLPLSRLVTLRLIGKLNDPELKIDELEQVIRQDLSLSYKLLRFVGSVGCAVSGQIHSIRHAVVLTGIARLRVWAALILFSGIEPKMSDLTVTAVARARMCEKLGEALKEDHHDQFFLVGLFSALPAVLNQPLQDILESLCLSPEINDALLHHTGIFGEVLKCVLAYERRDWYYVRCGNLASDTIRDAYVKAMAWSIGTLNGFTDGVTGDTAKQESLKYMRR